MRYLILSDVHANWEALQAVLADATGSYDDVCCLGDVVGYGADPNAVTDWVRTNVSRVIRGNHDKVCCGIEEPLLFNPIARKAAEWTRSTLTAPNRKYLRQLEAGPLETDGFLLVHGSVLDEDEYLLGPRDAEPHLDAASGKLVFFGHTHVQGGFMLRGVEGDDSPAEVPGDQGNVLPIMAGETYLLNPGSVGQPRDLVWQAAYAVFDSEEKTVAFRRCGYDLETAQSKILDAGLPPSLARRLAEGR